MPDPKCRVNVVDVAGASVSAAGFGTAVTHDGKLPRWKYKSEPPVFVIVNVVESVAPQARMSLLIELDDGVTIGAGNVVAVRQIVVSVALF